MQQINETRDKEFFTEVRKLAGFLIPVEASPTPLLNHEAQPTVSKTTISLDSGLGIWRSWTLWKDYSKGHPTHEKSIQETQLKSRIKGSHSKGYPPDIPIRCHSLLLDMPTSLLV